MDDKDTTNAVWDADNIELNYLFGQIELTGVLWDSPGSAWVEAGNMRGKWIVWVHCAPGLPV